MAATIKPLVSNSKPSRQKTWGGFRSWWAWLIAVLAGMGLGALFFYSGLQKLLSPYEFAEAILAYQLLSPLLVGVAAAILSWVEILAGLVLILGYFLGTLGLLAQIWRGRLHPTPPGERARRSGLLVVGLLSGVFLTVLILTLARGLKIDCGCGVFGPRQVGLTAVLEDLGLLAMIAALYRREVRSETQDDES